MGHITSLHQKAIVVDGHCDTILELLNKEHSFWDEHGTEQFNWTKAALGGINLQFMACYIEPEYKPLGAYNRVMQMLAQFKKIQAEGERQGRKLKLIRTTEQLQSLTAKDFQVLLSIEGGEAVEGQLDKLRNLFEFGFRSLTLTWNQRNLLADGVGVKGSMQGLTIFGKEVIAEMNRLGMLIDVSHLNEAGFWDVIEESTKPVAASHSCCRALCNQPRNLWDKQLKALHTNGGLIGINFCPDFLNDHKATSDHIIEHIEYAAEIAGIETVGLGSDFDGIPAAPVGIENASLMPVITEKLAVRGWKDEDIMKIIGGNYIRVLSQVLPAEKMES